jgi:hypothetical protein
MEVQIFTGVSVSYAEPFSLFLGAFAKLIKATINFVMSVRLPVHMEQLGSHLTDFHEI